ncbi:clathrin coat assembly protein AP180 [Amborella trichopoda]|uniref:ENTH domain-containing protein n=1 Tax=Amborella trichopoda TaxID=13333 RepID=W1PTM0_AMBTC|nr:clathrin coat assembly protein AP180 [Amborella trichopoda]ERN10640.1 hypothetical protein AMTR_s00028p00200060 [Amborella trichopoda]|eukprot:XP_006849059.1 clathrin coat assembly protein AP180 [Amborella trichopoda]
MPSKLKRALGAVKDQTSIGLAKVSSGSNRSNLDVAVLKATTHEEVPIEDRYINEILLLTSSSRPRTAACIHLLSRRISRTRSWVVALKSLTLILNLFQRGHPSFPREVLTAMNRGSRLLNLSNFCDGSHSSPWDFTAFVRTFALYLDEHLECSLMGKLRSTSKRRRAAEMNPGDILDRLPYWQRLLNRVLATRPTGPAKNNRLVQISLYTLVTESFELYKDISDGLAVLLDGFFQLRPQACTEAFDTCVRASKQFDELNRFYALCKGVGVGRISEFPPVQRISRKLLETLDEFLKDRHASLQKLSPLPPLTPPPPPTPTPRPRPRPTSDGGELKPSCSESLVQEPSCSESRTQDFDMSRDKWDIPLGDSKDSREGWELALPAQDICMRGDKSDLARCDSQDCREGWELALLESSLQMAKQVTYTLAEGFESVLNLHCYNNNPFMQVDAQGASDSIITVLPVPPTFRSTQCERPSFMEDDLFSTRSSTSFSDPMQQMSKQQLMLYEQRLWMQHQSSIISATPE